jgi:hypothetical protein
MGSNGPTWGNRAARHRMAAEEARKAREVADRLTVRAWNIGLDQGVATIQPSPTIGQAINGGYPWLRVQCTGCRTHALLDLRDIRRPATTPVWRLEGMLACAHCRMNGVRAPRAVIDRLSAAMVNVGWIEPREPGSDA